MTQFDFDPFLDWDSMNSAMVKDFHKALMAYRRAETVFMYDPTKDHAVEVMRANREVFDITSAIRETIWTQPVMVHLAGEKKHEDDEDEQKVIQRCTRCGSVLHMWSENYMLMTPQGPRQLDEDDVPWWELGAIVAKGSDEGGLTMSMYQIEEDRALEKHERECLDMSGILS